MFNQVVKISDTPLLTPEEKDHLVSLFPDNIKNLLDKVDNPLDEREILVELFKTNVRIMCVDDKNILGEQDTAFYFHCADVANIIKYSEKNVSQWNSRWKFNFVTYENLLLQFEGVKILNENTKDVINCKALFIKDQDLKKVLMKINTKEAGKYHDWILKQSELMSLISRKLIVFRKDLENSKLKEKNNKLQEELLELSQQAANLYPPAIRNEGFVYVSSSEDDIKKSRMKIGKDCSKNAIREVSLQTSNPEMKIRHQSKCLDAPIAESFLHKLLDHQRVYPNKEFFNISSLNVSIDMINDATEFVNDFINKYDNDYKLLQRRYINKEIILDDIQVDKNIVSINRGRSKSPKKVIVKEPVDIYKQYLDERTELSDKSHIHTSDLYTDFEDWFRMNNPNNTLPTNRLFIKELRKHIEVHRNVKVNGVPTMGVKNLKLKYDID